MDDLAARQTVRNELGVTLLALLDQEGVVVGDGLIESQGWLDAVPVQHRENAEDTDTVAILVVAVAADVGKVVVRRISGPQALGPAHGTHWKWRIGRHLPVPVLEVDNDGKGDTSVVRPSEDGTRDNGGPWIKILIHPVASARRHGSASSPCCSDNLGSGHDCQEAGETEFRSASGDAGQRIALPRRRGLAGDVGETDCPHMALTKRCRSDPTNDCQIATALAGKHRLENDDERHASSLPRALSYWRWCIWPYQVSPP